MEVLQRTASGRWAGLFLLLALAPLGAAGSQGPYAPDHPLAEGLGRKQQIALESIASQPEELHATILEVAVHEDVLVQLPAVWNDFDQAIAPLLEPYDEAERAALQDLLRHPGLLKTLIQDGPHDEAELRRRVESYPESIREMAVVVGRDHHPLLMRLIAPSSDAIDAFEALIAPKPAKAQQAFRDVVANPALASLLIEEFEVTRVLASSVRLSAAGTQAGLASLGRTVARKRKQAEEEDQRRREAAQRAAERPAPRRSTSARRLYWGSSYPYWGNRACWWDDPHQRRYGYVGRGHCWYPWHRYRRRWW